MKLLTVLLALVLPVAATASVTLFDDETQIGQFSKLQCGTNFTCANVSGKGKISLTQNPIGLMQNLITTSGDLTVAQCGSTVTSSLGRATFTLPSISNDDALGCRFTFFVLKTPTATTSNHGIIIDVDTADERIALLTDANGDSISADLKGETLTLEAINDDSTNGYIWAPVSYTGAWVDSN